MIRRLWNSPTLTTAGNTASKAANGFLVLLVVLAYFPAEDVAVWQLFLSLLALQLRLDLGLTATFTRAIAYGMGGARHVGDLTRDQAPTDGQPNWDTVGRVVATARRTYGRLSLGLVVVGAVLMTPLLIRPISAMADPFQAWLAWGVILASAAGMFYGRTYAAYLQAVNHVALRQRIEAAATLVAVIVCVVILLLGGGILALAIGRQACYLLNVLALRHFARRVMDGRWTTLKQIHDPQVFRDVWSRAWRTGVAMLLGFLSINAPAFAYAQFADPAMLATLLLAIRAMDTVSLFSQAPFHSKLPQLAQLQPAGQRDRLLAIATLGMNRAYLVFAGMAVLLAFTGQPILDLVGSDTRFPTPMLWSLFALGFFVQRHDAMVLQLHAITNQIVWHIAYGVTALLVLIAAMALYPIIGVNGFPLGLLLGHLAFSSWYSMGHCMRAFGLNPMTFERDTAGAGALLLAIGLGAFLWWTSGG